MSDDSQRTTFPTLEGASGEAYVLRSIMLNEPVAGKRGILGFAFQDADGDAAMPMLTAAGRVPVDTEGGNGTWSKNRNEVLSGAVSGSFAEVASITIGVDEIVDEYNFQVGVRGGGLFQVCHDDNGVINVLDDIPLDAGQYSFAASVKTLVTMGSTGTQRLLIRAYNWQTNVNQLSPLRAALRALVRD